MDKKKIIWIATSAALLVIVIAVVALKKQSPSGANVTPPAAPNAAPPPVPATRETAPTNVTVPDAGAKNVPANVAVPTNVTPLNKNTTETNRDFGIRAENNKFTPDTIIVHSGDNININFTAVDKNYDFSQPDYGYGDGKFVIYKGQTKKITFQITASGKFMFYCSLCGGPKSGPIGYIIAP